MNSTPVSLPVQTVWSNTFPHKVPMLLSLLLGSSLMLMILALYLTLPTQVPFFYSLARPEQYLGHKAWLFVFPGMSFTITLLHSWLILKLEDLDTFLAKLFAWVTVGVQVCLALAAVRIIVIIS